MPDTHPRGSRVEPSDGQVRAEDDHRVHRHGEHCTEATPAPHTLAGLFAGRFRAGSNEQSGIHGERNGSDDAERSCQALQFVAMPLSPFREVTVGRMESSGFISCDNP